MTVSPYSLAAYENLNIPASRRKVLNAIIEIGAPFTDQDLVKHMDWPINCITPRRGELEEHNLIGHIKRSHTESGAECGMYQLKSADGFKPLKKKKTASQRLKIALKALNDISMLSKDKLILNIADGALREMEK